jgi:hypothetical protein
VANQLVRANEIRAPTDGNDGLSPSQLFAYATAPPTLDEYLSAIITQIRSVIGSDHWYDEPPTNLVALLAAISAGGTTLPCAASITVGQVVMLDSTGTAQEADSGDPQLAIGIVRAKPTSTTAIVAQNGIVVGGALTLLTPGAVYFRGPTGGVILAPFDDTVSYIQPVGVALTSLSLLVQIAPQQIIRANVA